MIEIRKSYNEDSKKEYDLLIDGVLIDKVDVESFGKNPTTRETAYGIRLFDSEASERLTAHSLSELPEIEYLQFKHEFDGLPLVDHIWISQPSRQKNFYISFVYSPNLSEWMRTYSFADYYKEICKAISSVNNSEIEVEMYDHNEGIFHGFSVTFPCSSETPLANELILPSELLRSCHEETEAILRSRIEIRNAKDPNDKRKYQILIGSRPLDTVSVRGRPDDEGKIYFDIFTKDRNASRQMAAYSLEKLLPIEFLRLEYYRDDLKPIADSATIFISEDYIAESIENPRDNESRLKIINLGTYKCSITIEPSLSVWQAEYSFADYAMGIFQAFKNIDDSMKVSLVGEEGKALNREYIEEGSKEYEELAPEDIEKSYIHSLEIQFPYSSLQATIEDELRRFSRVFHPLHKEVIDILTSKVRNRSVIEYFEFPPEVSVACEQYLLYFSQFLKDLGVEATADIRHEAGQVLFAVTPKNRDEALDKIHAALKTYLQFASSPIGDNPDPEDDMTFQRLLANIDHLKGQLRLSYMMVRSQEATIQAQQVTIDSQQRALSGEVLLDSVKNVTPRPKDKDEEEVLNRLLTLGQYKNVGIAEALRRLKLIFKETKNDE